MKTLVPVKGLPTKALAVLLLLLPTYFISISAFATSTVSIEHRAGALCAPRTPGYGCRSSTYRQSSAVVMSSARHHHYTAAMPAVARTAMLLQRNPLFRRARGANTEHIGGSGRSRGTAATVKLEGATDDSAGSSPPAFSSTTGIYVAAASSSTIGNLDAAPAAAAMRADAAELGADAAAAAPLLSKKWGLKQQLQGLQRQLFDLPEDTAEEGRFLMMAALVGVITGTAGGFAPRVRYRQPSSRAAANKQRYGWKIASLSPCMCRLCCCVLCVFAPDLHTKKIGLAYKIYRGWGLVPR